MLSRIPNARQTAAVRRTSLRRPKLRARQRPRAKTTAMLSLSTNTRRPQMSARSEMWSMTRLMPMASSRTICSV